VFHNTLKDEIARSRANIRGCKTRIVFSTAWLITCVACLCMLLVWRHWVWAGFSGFMAAFFLACIHYQWEDLAYWMCTTQRNEFDAWFDHHTRTACREELRK
jgi:hypothetical protein